MTKPSPVENQGVSHCCTARKYCHVSDILGESERGAARGAAEMGISLGEGCSHVLGQRLILPVQFRRLTCPLESVATVEGKVIAEKLVCPLLGVWKRGQCDIVLERDGEKERKQETSVINGVNGRLTPDLTSSQPSVSSSTQEEIVCPEKP